MVIGRTHGMRVVTCLLALFTSLTVARAHAEGPSFDLLAAPLQISFFQAGIAGSPAQANVDSSAEVAVHRINNAGYTLEHSERTERGRMTRSAWARFKTQADAHRIVLHTFGSNIDTVLAAYRGTDLANLVRVAGNDNRIVPTLSATQSLVQFDVTADTEYRVQVGSRDGVEGDIRLTGFRFPPGGGLGAFLYSADGALVNGREYVCGLGTSDPSLLPQCPAMTFVLHNSTDQRLVVSTTTTLGPGVVRPRPFALAPGAVKVASVSFGPHHASRAGRTIAGKVIFTGRVGSAVVASAEHRALVYAKNPLTVPDTMRAELEIPVIPPGYRGEPLDFRVRLENIGGFTAVGCHFRSNLSGPANAFFDTQWQRINPLTGGNIGTQNLPVAIPAGRAMTFTVRSAGHLQYGAGPGSHLNAPVKIDCANTAIAGIELVNPVDYTIGGAFDATVQSLNFHLAPPLIMEPVGQTSTRAWYRALEPGRANDLSPWKQLVWFKKNSRTTPKSYFALVDFEQGTLRELPAMIPAVEPWAARWVNGKLYIGMNLPARLAVFDPVTESLTDLGPCFSGNSLTCFGVGVSPDGQLILHGAQGSDVSLFNPRTGQFTHFGEVAAEPGGGTYAYSASADERYLYVAVRSSDPWELVRVDRQTRERRVILTAPPDAHMVVVPWEGGAEVTHNGSKQWFFFRDGEAISYAYWEDNRKIVTIPESERPGPPVLPGPGFSGTAPGIAIDQSPILAGQEAVVVQIQTPDGTGWRPATLPLTLDSAPIGSLRPLDDGRLVGVPSAYYAMVLVDPRTGHTNRIPIQTSVYGLLPRGERIFLSGYPNARTMVYDTMRPMTWTESVPGRPGVPEEEPMANPRLLRFFGQDTGQAHIGMLLTSGADGNIYMIARRHRYFYGFELVSFSPEPGPNGDFVSGVFDDEGAFDHLQVTGMQSVGAGRQLLISTRVQHNKQLAGVPPRSAAVFLFDVARRKIVGRYEPLVGAQHIAVATMAEPGIIIGSAVQHREDAGSTTFRYNTRTRKLEQVRYVDWSLGDNFRLEADGQIWGSVLYGNYSVIFTLDRHNLRTTAKGRTAEAQDIGLCFQQGQLYLSGYPTIMRVLSNL